MDQFDDEWKTIKNKLESMEQHGSYVDNQENVFNTLLSMKQLELEMKVSKRKLQFGHNKIYLSDCHE